MGGQQPNPTQRSDSSLPGGALAARSVEQCVRHGVDFNSPFFKAECEGKDVMGSFYPDEYCTGQGRNQVSLSRVCTPIHTRDSAGSSEFMGR